MSKAPTRPPSAEFAKFKELSRKLVSVPKQEADKQAAQHDAKKKSKREKGKPKG